MRNPNNLSFIEMLTLILITLKFTNQIDWNWFEVWIPFVSREVFYLGARYYIDKKEK